MHFDGTVCAGGTYSDHGFNYSAPYSTVAGIHYDTIRTTNANGCDSIVTLTLTVNPVDSVLLEENVCAGNIYNYYGFSYEAPFITTPSVHYDTIRTTNVNGCDSIVSLVLTINPVDSVNFEESISAGATYNNHGFSYTAPYTTVVIVHHDTIRTTNSNGCDSIVTLALTVNPADSVHFDEAICAGNIYYEHGFSYDAPYSTVPSVYYDTIRTTNIFGSDSIVSLTLTVNPIDSVHLNDDVCAGSLYSDYGFNFFAPFSTIPSVHYDTIRTTNINGCDSIVTLVLTVNPVDSVHFDGTICAGGNYAEHGFNYSAPYSTVANIYYDTIRTTNVNGCDSIVTLTLTVNPVDSVHFEEVICAGNSYDGHGFTYDAPFSTLGSVHYDTIRTVNANGCDSVVTLTLTINPVDSVHFEEVVCAGNTYNNHGFTYEAPFSTLGSVHYDTIRTINSIGCDSVVTLTLTVNPVDSVHFEDTICAGSTYDSHGFIYEAPFNTSMSVHYDTIRTTNILGCDSIVTLLLVVNNNADIAIADTACNFFTWNDSTYYVSGDYIQHFNTVHGCDSIVTLHLTVHHSDTTHIPASACDSYTWNGVTYTSTGIYSQPFTNMHGCDSTAVLHLTIHQSVDTTVNVETCNSYVWNDSTYTLSGDYVRHFETSQGCDSTVTLHLVLHYDTTITFDAAACDSYEWNGTSYTTSGDYTQHLQTIHGCDSAVTLHLIISHSSTSEFTASGCENYTWNNQTYTQSGDYTQTFSNAVGCDSTVTLHLTIYNPVHTAVTQLACESYTWHGQTYTQSGTYTYSHTDAHGCTQVDTLHLDIGHPQHTATTETACETFTWNGQTYTQSGNYTYSHTDAHGCTQVDTLHLTVHHAVHEATTEVVCDSYTWNGQTYTQSGNYTYSHTDANGCTQVDTLHLTVHYSANTEEQLVLCREELPYSWNDTIFDTDAPTSATLVFHFLTVEGCDSTVTLQLTVHDPVHTAESDFACEPYHWNGQTYTESGTYTFAHPDANGCTQVDTLHLTFLDTTILIVPLTHNFCDNGSLTLEVQCALEDYLWSTGETSTTITVFDEGTYTVTASQGSCEVEASYTIVPCEYELLLPNAITPDGDGLNDEFSIPEAYFDHIGDAVFNVWIYNRWGTLVYSANSKYFRWNGEVDGKIYHHNVYNYVIEYNTPAGSPRRVVGSITVL